MDIQDELFDAQVVAAAEKKALELLDDPVQLKKLLTRTLSDKEQLQKDVVVARQERDDISADYARLTDAEGNYNMKDAAKLLKYKRGDGKQVGRNELFAFLRSMQFLNLDNTPAQSAIDNGWCDEVTGTYIRQGVEYTYVKTVVTPKGLDRIRRLMDDAFDDWWDCR